MGLSNDLLSQFAKMAKPEQETSKETTVQGVAKVEHDGVIFVQLDGSDRWTPVSTTVDVKDGEKVNVMIKDHTATITGNISSPSARTDDVKEISAKLSEFDIIVSYRVTTDDLSAINATIENLKATTARIGNLEVVLAEIETLQAKYASFETISAKDAEILNAEIESLQATFGEFTDISTEDLEAINADIDNLKAYNAEFTYVSAEVLEAIKASIKELDVKKLNATEADIKYANIDFANIGEAAFEKLFSESGLIANLVVESGTIAGELVGVTIKGDLIEAGTLVADKLVVKGEDGLYYKLNFESGNFTDAEEVPTDSLHGSVITAKSITAEKITVSDLVAFGATIGGFNIGQNAIYSGVKASIDNSTTGIYMDNSGQLSVGDSLNYIKYYKVLDESGNEKLDESGNPIYRLEVSADSVVFGDSGRTAGDLEELADTFKIEKYIDPNTGSEKLRVELEDDESKDKLLLTNDTILFEDDEKEGTKVTKESITTDALTVNKEFRQGPLAWGFRGNGNYGLMWKGANN